jgi:predicted nucleotidyltransferase
MTKETIIEILRKEYPYLASEYGVKRLGVFGSHAKGLATEVSDVDLLVEFTQPIGFKFIEFTEYLESLLGKSVDVLTPGGIEGIRIERIAQGIQESVVYV